MQNNPKNFSVKIIKGNAYIYSWSYRRKTYRTHSTLQRYHWKYRGRYGTRKVRDFIKRLSIKEQNHLKEEVEKKLESYLETQKKIKCLLSIEPFKSRYNRIMQRKNRLIREDELKALYSELNNIIKADN